MTKPTLQIDLKPVTPGPEFSSYYIKICFDGGTYTGICSKEEADKMEHYGLVKQVKGQRHDDDGKLIEFDYPEKVDGAGVQFTSKIFIEK